jgi:HEPN superfamily AbiU2-like protein
MNTDQRSNIEAMVNANMEALFSAWSYFHLLQGMHKGSKGHPVVVQKFDRFFDQVWRAVFDGLFSKAGTLIDRTRGAQSLPNLLTLARKYGDAELRILVKQAQASLQAREGPVAKIESWRHKVVAHRTREGRETTFYVSNKMNLEEVASGLSQLEELLNVISLEVLRVINDTETGSEDLVQQGIDLFSCVAEHPSLRRPSA